MASGFGAGGRSPSPIREVSRSGGASPRGAASPLRSGSGSPAREARTPDRSRVASPSSEPTPEVLAEAEARLAQVLEVNRVLLAAEAAKRRQLNESQEAIAVLEKRLEACSSRKPLRREAIEKLQGPRKTSRQARDAAELAQAIVKMELQVVAANDRNLRLSDRHREDRQKLIALRSSLKALDRREQELARYTEHIADRLNEAIGGEAAAEQGSQHDALPLDYRALPGLYLSKLTGCAPPPGAAGPNEEPALASLAASGAPSRSPSRAASSSRQDRSPASSLLVTPEVRPPSGPKGPSRPASVRGAAKARHSGAAGLAPGAA